MPFAAALSQHPLATQAVGEVTGQVLERLGSAPDLAVLFASASHVGAMEDIAGAVQALLGPGALIGCTAASVVGGSREVEDQPALSLWAGRLAAATPLRLMAVRRDGGMAITGLPDPASLPEDAAALLVLADPFSFPADVFLTGLRDQAGLELPVVGGLASAARGPGGNRLVLGTDVVSDGAVAVVLAGVEVATVVSQGCRPIGDPLTVTRGEGHLILELAGRPALERVQELVASLGPHDLALAQQGLHVGRVIDEHKLDYGRGTSSSATSSAATATPGRWLSAIRSTWATPCSSRCATPTQRTRTWLRSWPGPTATVPCCSRATGGVRTFSSTRP